ncbi:MAG TPA: DUF4152 domain-containing protein [Candidatus Methanomethylia archaeon]|nr:DUF4152 domain-containing protein [Candidatus Methanomethylicia archaeon]
MLIAAADSGVALLDEEYAPLRIVASAAVVVDSESRRVVWRTGKEVFSDPRGRSCILEELKLLLRAAELFEVKEVHVDITLGGEELTTITLNGAWRKKVSKEGLKYLEEILPEVSRIAREIRKLCGARVLAIGKESWAIRLAEISACIYGLKHLLRRAYNGEKLRVGLPRKCLVEDRGECILLRAETPFGEYREEIPKLETLEIRVYENPLVEEFYVVEILPGSS